ncbi:MAG: hypothetical protein JO353_08905, partial [Phycisphaerae bacterium]|nr:hypothetical protein [Phycisphaerae bacterium]
MKTILTIVNAAGIAVVACLCMRQWHFIEQLDADRDRLELIRRSQQTQIVQQATTIRNQTADLDDLHTRLTTADR